MNNLHFIHEGLYESKFISFINNNKLNETNKFLVFETKNSLANMEKFTNVIMENINFKKEYFTIKKICKNADKIYLHGLFSKKWVLFFYLNPHLLKKTNWVIWGGDLYYYKYAINSMKSKIYEFIRKKVIKNLSEITAFIKGDYEIAQKIYNTKAKYNYAFYPNPIDFDSLDKVLASIDKEKYTTTIQIGNSADPTNEHIEILNILSVHKNKNIKIICPLSYGNKEHANRVIQYGNKIFGDKFQPLTEYMPPEEYSKILANIDIAIFNHQRQQALGNIIGLLYLGKKVYIRSDITPWEYFDNFGVKLYDTKNIKNNKFEGLISFDDSVGQANKKIVAKEFSEEHCVQLWRKVLYEGE
ncbi:4-alpha-L-fucosyltransferase [Clostridium homopropionicum DSM 5847]|uniref:4-alpha-L-fucosyltransferase n=1 Tax=Clostridium homopropionicum DSM 5847 TaxID=1121318 RepID=A0A0L6ZEG4_9CLOT|nr:TDP-N-acetylfucosamine:lipid II N-acetylfucosaminyltransferase [Clostridium homopropionicum]KOA21337.1 4-alpha-L-fucosyltransferase [Clostridium homopropionicum DSM 5847]SFG98288.1 Glycosyltransferase involved in cell wall bisynthesis [Clostridium homopropionicum]